MGTKTLILACLFVRFTFTGCGPSAAEKRAQQVAEAKDNALKVRQQLAQAKTGAEAENLRQQMMKRLNDAGLSVEAIHFTDAELSDYVKSANAAAAPAPVVKPATHKATGRRAGKKKKGR